MGIRHLSNVLSNICKDNGIYRFKSVDDFLRKEKYALYKSTVASKKITNPLRQMQIKKTIEDKPYFVGIDACLYAARYKRVFKKIEYGFFRQIILSLSSKMIPIYVFDGNIPDQKRKTIINRQNKKRRSRSKLEDILFSSGLVPTKIDEQHEVSELSVDELITHINSVYGNMIQDENTQKDPNDCLLYYNDTKCDEYNELIRLSKKSIGVDYEDIQNLKNFLDLIKIPYITANKEADDLMASLYNNGIIQACQSDDMDMLPKGCGSVIQITNHGVVQYSLKKILAELGMTQKQFIDFCVLLGSDYYNTYLPKVKPMELYDIFKSLPEPSLESFVEYYATFDPVITSHLEAYQKSRNSFLFLSESSDKNFLNYRLMPFNAEDILEHLTKIGINISDNLNKRIRTMIKNTNNIIAGLNYVETMII